MEINSPPRNKCDTQVLMSQYLSVHDLVSLVAFDKIYHQERSRKGTKMEINSPPRNKCDTQVLISQDL